MKRLLTLAALLMLVLGINAQDKKTWDFTQGLSEETVANLNAMLPTGRLMEQMLQVV